MEIKGNHNPPPPKKKGNWAQRRNIKHNKRENALTNSVPILLDTIGLSKMKAERRDAPECLSCHLAVDPSTKHAASLWCSGHQNRNPWVLQEHVGVPPSMDHHRVARKVLCCPHHTRTHHSHCTHWTAFPKEPMADVCMCVCVPSVCSPCTQSGPASIREPPCVCLCRCVFVSVCVCVGVCLCRCVQYSMCVCRCVFVSVCTVQVGVVSVGVGVLWHEGLTGLPVCRRRRTVSPVDESWEKSVPLMEDQHNNQQDHMHPYNGESTQQSERSHMSILINGWLTSCSSLTWYTKCPRKRQQRRTLIKTRLVPTWMIPLRLPLLSLKLPSYWTADNTKQKHHGQCRMLKLIHNPQLVITHETKWLGKHNNQPGQHCKQLVKIQELLI